MSGTPVCTPNGFSVPGGLWIKSKTLKVGSKMGNATGNCASNQLTHIVKQYWFPTNATVNGHLSIFITQGRCLRHWRSLRQFLGTRLRFFHFNIFFSIWIQCFITVLAEEKKSRSDYWELLNHFITPESGMPFRSRLDSFHSNTVDFVKQLNFLSYLNALPPGSWEPVICHLLC